MKHYDIQWKAGQPEFTTASALAYSMQLALECGAFAKEYTLFGMAAQLIAGDY